MRSNSWLQKMFAKKPQSTSKLKKVSILKRKHSHSKSTPVPTIDKQPQNKYQPLKNRSEIQNIYTDKDKDSKQQANYQKQISQISSQIKTLTIEENAMIQQKQQLKNLIKNMQLIDPNKLQQIKVIINEIKAQIDKKSIKFNLINSQMDRYLNSKIMQDYDKLKIQRYLKQTILQDLDKHFQKSLQNIQKKILVPVPNQKNQKFQQKCQKILKILKSQSQNKLNLINQEKDSQLKSIIQKIKIQIQQQRQSENKKYKSFFNQEENRLNEEEKKLLSLEAQLKQRQLQIINQECNINKLNEQTDKELKKLMKIQLEREKDDCNKQKQKLQKQKQNNSNLRNINNSSQSSKFGQILLQFERLQKKSIQLKKQQLESKYLKKKQDYIKQQQFYNRYILQCQKLLKKYQMQTRCVQMNQAFNEQQQDYELKFIKQYYNQQINRLYACFKQKDIRKSFFYSSEDYTILKKEIQNLQQKLSRAYSQHRYYSVKQNQNKIQIKQLQAKLNTLQKAIQQSIFRKNNLIRIKLQIEQRLTSLERSKQQEKAKKQILFKKKAE